ncbi:MAG: phosphate ABC transporter permease PstA [Planctomycetes bacterium]|nr:phosphate ABC transporter permease PstA [Planctomycetota bacterium]
MIIGLMVLIVKEGGSTFWPQRVVRIDSTDGTSRMGEISSTEMYVPGPHVMAGLSDDTARRVRDVIAADGGVRRRMLRSGNFDLTGTHYTWIDDFAASGESLPEWAVVVERMSWGRFYGFPKAFVIENEVVARGPEAAWSRFKSVHASVRARFEERQDLETGAIGAINAEMEAGRLALRKAELSSGTGSFEYEQARALNDEQQIELKSRFESARDAVRTLDAENARYQLLFETADGAEMTIPAVDIVRAYAANQLGFVERVAVYLSRWWEFLSEAPREANSEGGVFPAIIGTVVMTLVMAILAVPFGVLAALYLREYATQGWLVSIVRIAVNNLAGVPSIVFGVFGLGFFCYVVGASVDTLLYAEKLPNPTYGKGGLIWAAFTLGLLTLPVVIVATEEALAAVPRSMREGSYACGATKWQTIRRIVLPRALPGIMTGMILAIARGAGEVAPLMLVGAVKLAPELVVEANSTAPFVHLHPERSFMHLGFHIYDLGFQSQNSEAARPMVYTTTLLLIAIIVILNITAIWVRERLKRRYAAGAF